MDAAARGRRRRLPAREEELLGLLAGFPDGGGEYGSDRELSFSDLVDAGASSGPCVHHHAAAPAARDHHGGTLSPGKQEETASKQRREQAAPRETRQRRQRSSGNRGSCGGDGVLLNFYVPGLLTRSITAPRPGRGVLPPPGAAPAKAAAVAPGKARTQGPFGIGCWPSLWGRRQAKACS